MPIQVCSICIIRVCIHKNEGNKSLNILYKSYKLQQLNYCHDWSIWTAFSPKTQTTRSTSGSTSSAMTSHENGPNDSKRDLWTVLLSTHPPACWEPRRQHVPSPWTDTRRGKRAAKRQSSSAASRSSWCPGSVRWSRVREGGVRGWWG